MLPPKEGDAPEVKQARINEIWDQLQRIITKNADQDPRQEHYLLRGYAQDDKFYDIIEYKDQEGLQHKELGGFLDPSFHKVQELIYPIYEFDPEINISSPDDMSIQNLPSEFGLIPEFFHDTEGQKYSYSRRIILARDIMGNLQMLRCEFYDKEETDEPFPAGPERVPGDGQIVEADSIDVENIEKALTEIESGQLKYHPLAD